MAAKKSKESSYKGREQTTTQTSTASAKENLALFEALCEEGEVFINAREIIQTLEKMGVYLSDPRLKALRDYLEIDKSRRQNDYLLKKIDHRAFEELMGRSALLRKCLQSGLTVPEFEAFTKTMETIFLKSKEKTGGAVATYIPQLARVDPELYAVSICTLDGQRFSLGDYKTTFCVQSACKPILYCIAQQELGQEHVHKHIGFEPSGRGFNELSLDRNNLPHNPMINAGAIMSCSLIKRKANAADRFEHVMNIFRKLSGGGKVNFENTVYLSERETADRNFALAYFMREKNAFPEDTNITKTLEFYFQCCSIETDAESYAMVAATLANSGICPITGSRVFEDLTVKNCLSLMLTCGMYDYSGEFAFKIGFPAKSGVSGVMMVVIPDLLGMCIWSPRLDSLGNSVRGVEFCRLLAQEYNMHKFEGLSSKSPDRDPKSKKYEAGYRDVLALISAASGGDLLEIKRLIASGVNLDRGDYDYRTALHLASAEGQLDVVRFLIEKGAKVNPKDRWGRTPLADARAAQLQELEDFLISKGAEE